MAGRTEHVFTELGYFQDAQCEAIKAHLQGETYMRFDIRWSSWAGNCTLVVATERPGTTEQELAGMFLHRALSEIWLLTREALGGRG